MNIPAVPILPRRVVVRLTRGKSDPGRLATVEFPPQRRERIGGARWRWTGNRVGLPEYRAIVDK